MIILLNGPPSSGKDTVTKLIRKQLANIMEWKMSYPLRRAFAAALQLPPNMVGLMLETYKDDPIFSGRTVTPRTWQIMFHKFMKDLFGDDYLGRIAVAGMRQLMTKHIIVDIGMMEEVKPLIKEFGLDNIRAIQLSRPDCDYSIDSRSDLDFDKVDITWLPLNNRHDLDMLSIQVARILEKWELIIRDV